MIISWLVQENVKNYPHTQAVEMKIIMLFMNYTRMSSCFRKLQEATKVLSNLGLNVNLCFITSSPDINNRVKEWDLAKLDADWKSVIAFVAEWSVKVRIVRFGNWECGEF